MLSTRIKNSWVVLVQLFKEFWLSLIIATSWSFYSVIGQTEASIIKFVGTFGATFFFVSWFTGQYFRVRKQNKVDKDFQSIHKGLGSVVEELKQATNDLIGYQTGGDSFCYLMNSAGMEMVIHKGKYPLYGVSALIVDVDELSVLSKSGKLTLTSLNKHIRSYGELIPGHCKTGATQLLGEGEQRSFNIFWTTRSGGFIQLLRYKKVNGVWYHATKVERDGMIFEDIQPGYPRNIQGKIDW